MHETQSNPITTRRSYPAAQQLLQEEHNVAEMRILKEPMHKPFQFSSHLQMQEMGICKIFQSPL